MSREIGNGKIFPDHLTPVERHIYEKLRSLRPDDYYDCGGVPYKVSDLLTHLVRRTPVGQKLVEDFKAEEWSKVNLMGDSKTRFGVVWKPKDAKE